MPLLITVALLNGAVNIINKMVNVVAKQSLGMANGTLINYLEATLIALALAFLVGDRHLLDPGYLGSIPLVYYLGGFFGLAAMVLTIRGMEKVPVAVSAVVILAGQLLAGFVMDTLAGRVGPKELLGLCLVGAGVWWNNRQSQAARPPEGEAAA